MNSRSILRKALATTSVLAQQQLHGGAFKSNKAFISVEPIITNLAAVHRVTKSAHTSTLPPLYQNKVVAHALSSRRPNFCTPTTDTNEIASSTTTLRGYATFVDFFKKKMNAPQQKDEQQQQHKEQQQQQQQQQQTTTNKPRFDAIKIDIDPPLTLEEEDSIRGYANTFFDHLMNERTMVLGLYEKHKIDLKKLDMHLWIQAMYLASSRMHQLKQWRESEALLLRVIAFAKANGVPLTLKPDPYFFGSAHLHLGMLFLSRQDIEPNYDRAEAEMNKTIELFEQIINAPSDSEIFDASLFDADDIKLKCRVLLASCYARRAQVRRAAQRPRQQVLEDQDRSAEITAGLPKLPLDQVIAALQHRISYLTELQRFDKIVEVCDEGLRLKPGDEEFTQHRAKAQQALAAAAAAAAGQRQQRQQQQQQQ